MIAALLPSTRAIAAMAEAPAMVGRSQAAATGMTYGTRPAAAAAGWREEVGARTGTSRGEERAAGSWAGGVVHRPIQCRRVPRTEQAGRRLAGLRWRTGGRGKRERI